MAEKLKSHKDNMVEPQTQEKSIVSAIFKGTKESIVDNLIYGVAIPAFVDLVTRGIEDSISILFTGDKRVVERNRGKSARGDKTYFVDYSGCSNSKDRKAMESNPNRYDFSQYEFRSKQGAEDALDDLASALEEYPDISIADFFQSIGKDVIPQDHKLGWTDLRGAYTERGDNGGYVIHFPRPRRL